MASIEKLREELQTCKKPLIFFHDDPDGLASFLLLYRYVGEGKGIVVKTTPKVDLKFIRKVEEYDPDKIFIVDLAMVDQEFIDAAKKPIVWIDHHEPLERRNVVYYNPRKELNKNLPASYVCYKVVEENLWIAMCGIIGDWHMPEFAKEFAKDYPNLFPKNIKKPEDAIYKSKLGNLIRIFSFILKGKTRDALTCVKIMTRIKEPGEILEQTTSQGRYIYKRFQRINDLYKPLIQKAKKISKKEKLIIFKYKADEISFTSDLSNELIYNHPDRLVLIAREKSGEMKCSLRSSRIIIPKLLEKALEGLEAHGGGHEHACGAVVKVEDFNTFIERIKEEL